MTIALLIQVIILLVVCGLLVLAVQRVPGMPRPILAAVEILILLIFALIILERSALLPL